MASGALTESLRETLSVFESEGEPGEPMTTNEVTTHLDISRRSTYSRLERLADRGLLETKKVGAKGRIWWRPPSSGSPDDSADGEPTGPDAERRLSRFVETLSGFVHRCPADAPWEPSHVSEGCAELTGYDSDRLESGDVRWKEVVEPEDREGTLADIATQLESEEEFTVEYRIRTADDEVRWVRERGQVLAGDSDDGRFVESAVIDVTAQRQSERALSVEESFTESLLDTQRDIVYAIDTEGTFVRWNDRLLEVTGYTDEEISAMHPVEFLADDVETEAIEAIAEVLEERETRTLELPLVTADGTEIPYEFTGSPLTDESGEVIGLTGIGRDVSERKARERQLRRQREDLAAELDEVFARIDDAFYAVDDDFRFTYANDRAEELLRHSEEELLGRSVWDVFPDATETPAYDAFHEALETQEQRSYEVLFDALGFWVEASVYPSENGLSVYFRDVTDQKARERELERYETVARTASDVFLTIDTDSVIQEVNPAVEEVFGYEPEALEGEPLTTLMPDELADAHLDAIARYLRGGEAHLDWEYVELPGVRSDGTEISLAVSFSEYEHGGERFFTGIVRDITERKATEEALDRSERQFQRLMDNVPGMVYRCRHELGWPMEFVSDACRQLTGYEPERLERGEVSFGEDVVLDEDREELWGDVQQGLDDGGEFLVTYRIRTQDGNVRWVRERGRGIYREDGSLEAIEGIIIDVTERKHLETEMDEIFGRVTDAFCALDENWQITYVNDRAEDLIDFDGGNLHGQKVWDVFEWGSDSPLRRRFEGAMETQEPTAFELYNPEPHDAWYEVHAYPSKTGLSVYFRDVSDRKEREQELAESRRWNRTLIEHFPNGAVTLVDDDLRYLTVGGRAIPGTDASPEELAGEGLYDVLPEELATELGPGYERALSGETTTFEFEFEGQHFQVRVVPVRDDDGEVYAAMGMSQDVTDRIQHRRELERRVRELQVITELGQRGLGDRDIDRLMADASELVADTLDNDFCKVLDLDADADELVLRQGVGWQDGLVGDATVSAVEADSQAAYTLATEEPVVVEDLTTETRFSGPDLLTDHDVHSGISVVIGSGDEPWGILGTHDTDSREFSPQDVNFVQSVANILATVINRHEDERALRQQRERLAALNDLNQVVREVTDAVIARSTRNEVEQAVCDYLASSESYLFAWTAGVDRTSESITVRQESGAEDYLAEIDLSTDPDDERSRGPTGRALRTGEMQTTTDVQDDPAFEPWREIAERHGIRSSAAIPIAHEGTTYGVLNVYAGRPDAFAGQESEVIGQLGEIVGHAIAAVERKEALMSDQMVEIEFQIPDLFDILNVEAEPSGLITLDETIPLGGEAYLVYGTATEEGVDAVSALVEQVPHWESVRFQDGNGDRAFEVRLSQPPVLSMLASLGGSLAGGRIEDGDYYMTLHLSPSTDARKLIDAVLEAYPTAEMVTRRQISRTDDSEGRLDRVLVESLTDRQRAALRAAYHAGFFDWPREASGEDVADSLDVSAPTFHQHLRKAEQKIFETMLSNF